MSKEKDKIIFGPWTKKNDQPRVLLSDFLVRLREHLASIIAIPQELGTLSGLFDIGQKPASGKYEAAVTTLSAIHEPVYAFCELLDTSIHLPISIVALRYPLIVTLHHIDEEVSATLLCIRAFDMACDISSKQVHQHQLLRQKLASLAQNFDEVIHRANLLLDQAQFEERRLTQLTPPDTIGIDDVEGDDNDLADSRIISFTSAQQRRFVITDGEGSLHKDQ